jgi:hypothetical protein
METAVTNPAAQIDFSRASYLLEGLNCEFVHPDGHTTWR